MKKETMMDGLLTLAQKPPDNPASLEMFEQLARYEITPIDHDYAGKTSAMWNTVHHHLGVTGGMAMMVGVPADAATLMSSFRHDTKYAGGGVGAGFKEAVVPHLDEVTPLARAMGAVNVIKKMPDGRLAGDNTDGKGYVQSLEQVLAEQGRTLKGAEVLVFGAGGSSRAISFALADRGARLTILNRTESKAEALADAVNRYAGATVAVGGGRILIPEVLPLMDAVVSTVDDPHSPLDQYSPLGDMALPVTPESVRKNREQTAALLRGAKPGLVVSDIRIRTEETPMLKEARAHKLPSLNGIPMVVHQGVAAFWWLYGKELAARDIERADVEDVMWWAV